MNKFIKLLLGAWVVLLILLLINGGYDGFIWTLVFGLFILFAIYPQNVFFFFGLVFYGIFRQTKKGKEFEAASEIRDDKKHCFTFHSGMGPTSEKEFLRGFSKAVCLGFGKECIEDGKTPATLDEAKDWAIKLFYENRWPSFQELKKSNLTIETIFAFFLSIMKQRENEREKVIFHGINNFYGGLYPYAEESKRKFPYCLFPREVKFDPRWSMADQDIWKGRNIKAKAMLYARKEREKYMKTEDVREYNELQAKRAAFAAGYRHPEDEINLIRRFIAADTAEFPDWEPYCQIKLFLTPDGSKPNLAEHDRKERAMKEIECYGFDLSYMKDPETGNMSNLYWSKSFDECFGWYFELIRLYQKYQALGGHDDLVDSSKRDKIPDEMDKGYWEKKIKNLTK